MPINWLAGWLGGREELELQLMVVGGGEHSRLILYPSVVSAARRGALQQLDARGHRALKFFGGGGVYRSRLERVDLHCLENPRHGVVRNSRSALG